MKTWSNKINCLIKMAKHEKVTFIHGENEKTISIGLVKKNNNENLE